MSQTVYFLTDDVVGDWLPDDVVARDDFDRLRYRAEQTIIDRYRVVPKRSRTRSPASPTSEGIVQLDGWQEDRTTGTPEPDEMRDELVTAIRDAASRLVEHRVNAPDRGISSERRGARSVHYRTSSSGVPPRVYAPLRRFDLRVPWH